MRWIKINNESHRFTRSVQAFFSMSSDRWEVASYWSFDSEGVKVDTFLSPQYPHSYSVHPTRGDDGALTPPSSPWGPAAPVRVG